MPKLYTFEVYIIEGLMTHAFIDKNQMLLRTIQVRGDQCLGDFHNAIFQAFDRFDEHMYEFQIGGKGPMDPSAKRYVLPTMMQDAFDGGPPPAGDVLHASIDSLGLEVDDVFGYWFDFGDNWWHDIYLCAIEDEAPAGNYPKLIKSKGESPPQYPDPDELNAESEQSGEIIPLFKSTAPALSAEDRERYQALLELTDAFCDEHLNDEYKQLCHALAATMRYAGISITGGKIMGWAAGMVHTLGFVNFLSDRNTSPHMTPKQFQEGFGVSIATIQNRSTQIRNTLDIHRMDPTWTLPSMLDNNPMIWLLEVNGLMIDIRNAPREAQVVAYEQGLIPYIPADREAEPSSLN